MKKFSIKDLSGRGYTSKLTFDQIIKGDLLGNYEAEEQEEIKEFLQRATTGDEYSTSNLKFVCL